MPIVYDTERKLASAETIDAITPIDGADNIDAATVRGWTVVVKKGEYKVGDTVLYIELDTALPVETEGYSFLKPNRTVDGVEYHVLRTKRLRGIYSQGLVLPLPEGTVVSPGEDVTEFLGLGKWEKPVPVSLSKGSMQAGNFLHQYARKSDSERVQNLGKYWDRLKDEDWLQMEKLDGTSLTVIRDQEGELRVCSRNWEITRSDDSVYWQAVLDYNLGDFLEPNEALQAELCGPGIQSNRLDLKKLRPYVFQMFRYGKVLSPVEAQELVGELHLPIFAGELSHFDTITDIVEYVEGMKSRLNPSRLAEGLVFHTESGNDTTLLGRNTFKVINNKYLLKED